MKSRIQVRTKSGLIFVMLASLYTGAALAQAAPAAADHAQQRAAKLEQRFKQADTNGDGALSREEAAGMPGLARHFDRLDADKDGKITLDELRTAQERGHARRAEKGKDGKGEKAGKGEKFLQRFKAADKDGDGALSKAEAEAGNMPRIAKNFDQIDANKDGKITPDELRDAMNKMREQRKAQKELKESKDSK